MQFKRFFSPAADKSQRLKISVTPLPCSLVYRNIMPVIKIFPFVDDGREGKNKTITVFLRQVLMYLFTNKSCTLTTASWTRCTIVYIFTKSWFAVVHLYTTKGARNIMYLFTAVMYNILGFKELFNPGICLKIKNQQKEFSFQISNNGP